MPPCPGHHLDTDAAMEDHRSPVLLMGLGNGKSYGAVEQAPMFKNAHAQKAPPGKCLVEESMWNDEETWAEHDGMRTPPSKTNTAVLAAASSAPSEPSASPANAKKKRTQRKLDAELKNTQVPGPSKDAAAGGGSKSNKTRPFKKDYEFVCSSLLVLDPPMSSSHLSLTPYLAWCLQNPLPPRNGLDVATSCLFHCIQLSA